MNRQESMIVGLTGQTGAGKSTLSRLFAERGVSVIDADSVARDTMENSNLVLTDLVLEFSTEVIHPDASLNREKLALICFSDKEKLKRLNDITYPYIIQAILRKIEAACAGGARMVLLDAPTLYESGLNKQCDRVVAVLANRETRVARIIARDGLSEDAALLRVNAQNSDEFYTGRADDILTNDEDVDALSFAFMELFGRYERMLDEGSFREDRSARGKKPPQAEAAELPDAEQEPPETPVTPPPDRGALEELTGQND